MHKKHYLFEAQSALRNISGKFISPAKIVVNKLFLHENKGNELYYKVPQLTATHQAGIIPIFVPRFKQNMVEISLLESRIPESSSHYVTARD